MNKRMTYCNDCNQEISKHANPCPNCGAKRMTPGRYLFWGILLAIFIIYKASFYLNDKREKDRKANIASKHLSSGAILKSSGDQLIEKTVTTTHLGKIISQLNLTYSWQTVFLMNGFIGDAKIQNTANHSINSILITCKTYDLFANQTGSANYQPAIELTAYQTKSFTFRMDSNMPDNIHSVKCYISNALK